MKAHNFSTVFFSISTLLIFVSVEFSEQSVLKAFKDSLPILDSSLSSYQYDIVVPRREDDYTVLANEDPELKMTTETVQFDTINDEAEDEGKTTTELPTTVRQVNEEEGVEDVKKFATFGSGYRPVFPVDVTVNVKSNVTKESSSISHSFPQNTTTVGLVDVNLAKLANINVFSSNASQLDIFASKSGLNCTCGKINVDTTRIVNGVPVKINQIPWTAALFKRNWLGFYGSKPYCGGSLINNLYIITASHCVDGMSARSIKVRLNEEDTTKLNENDQAYQEFTVSEIIMHKDYNRRTIDNDIALLKLASPVELKEDGIITPVCLPANNKNELASYVGFVAGWGTVSQGGAQSTVLRQAQVPIMSNEDCNTKTVYTGKVTDNMLCAGLLEGGVDACQGDSGGPLIISNNERRMIVGIVSWGYGCSRPKSPGVYARVGRYSDWLLTNTKGAEWCSS